MNAIRPLGSASPENDQMRESLGQYWESIAFTVIDFGSFIS
jgi:hypothetical protein